MKSATANNGDIELDPAPLPSNVPPPSRAASAVTNRTAISEELHDWQLDAMKTIANLGRLPTGWDGYGSRAPVEAVRGWARGLVTRTYLGILPVPKFGPESDGGLEIDWESGHAREIEFHVQEGQPISYLKVEAGEPIEEGTLAFDDEDMPNELLTWLRRG
jgi:hypothetical protein